MFEKEAEEYAIENWEHYEEGQNDSKALKQAYQQGAEFGYNKANERLTKAKELLTRWVELFKPKGGNIPPTPVHVETEQFLSGQPEQIEKSKENGGSRT